MLFPPARGVADEPPQGSRALHERALGHADAREVHAELAALFEAGGDRLEVAEDRRLFEHAVAHGSHEFGVGAEWRGLVGLSHLAHGGDFFAEAVACEHLVVEVAHVGDVPGNGAGGLEPGLFDVGVDDNREGGDALDSVGRAAGGGCSLADPGLAFLEFGLRPVDRHPTIGRGGERAHALRGDGGDVDGDVLADGLEEELEAALELVDLAVVEDFFAADDHVDDVNVFPGALDRLGELLTMPVLDDAGARGAEADDHAAAAELVEGREGHREDRGRASEDRRDARAKLDRPGFEGGLGEERELVASPRFGGEDSFDADFLRDFDARDGFAVLFRVAGEPDTNSKPPGHASPYQWERLSVA